MCTSFTKLKVKLNYTPRHCFVTQCNKSALCHAVQAGAHVTKAGYTERVKSVLRSRVSKLVAKRCALGLKKVCQEVIAKKGAATSG